MATWSISVNIMRDIMPAAPPSQRLTGSSYPSVSCRGHLRLALGCSKHSDVADARTHDGIMKGRARHWNANLLIEGDGDEATMTCYLLALTTGSSIRGSTGIYRDRLRRRNGAWRFAERHIAIDVAPG